MTGRPRSFDRDRALEIARDVFWRSGYDQASIAQLTREMGINPPSLYAAFGDKRRLFEESVDLYLRSFDAGVYESLAQATAHDAIAELLHQAAVVQTEPGTPPGCLVLSEPALRAERDRLRERIAARLRRGKADNELAADLDPDGLAAYLEAVLIGMSARAREGAGRDELLVTARTALAALD